MKPSLSRLLPKTQRGKTFVHDIIPYIEIKSEDTPNGRFYTLPDGTKLHSMTTMLGLTSDHTWLEEWRARIGEEAAKIETERCAVRGEAVHLSCELYVKNEPMEKVLEACEGHTKLFFQLKPVLDKRIGKVLAIEIPLFSKKMRVAGRVDLICYWLHEGVWKLAIVDFKTSNWIKNKNDIEDYQAQLCGYAMCLYEMTGLKPEILVNIIATENSVTPTMPIFSLSESLPVLKQRLNMFYALLDKEYEAGESGNGNSPR